MSICSTHRSSKDAPEATIVLERIQVAYDRVEGPDAQLRDLLAVRDHTLVGQDAGMDEGVQGLHRPSKNLGKTGHVVDRGDGHARRHNTSGRESGGDDLHAGIAERAGEILQPGLVVDEIQGRLMGRTSTGSRLSGRRT